VVPNQMKCRFCHLLTLARAQATTLFVAALLFSWQFTLAEAQTRNPRWATSIEMEGVHNLFQVSPDLYRAAQITDQAIPLLAKAPFGIRTVVSLRYFHDDLRLLSPSTLTLSGIHYDRIASNAGHPEDGDVLRFLAIIATAPKPILIHCQHGADRTGFMSAIYRIVVQGWSKKEAMDELLNGDYGANRVLGRFTQYFIEHMDVSAIRQKAGLR
jgi:protein tyrosine phosphatase (PTP) superfamily phosphohydrolase (DUF442 family)